jgi:hypothetical protein
MVWEFIRIINVKNNNPPFKKVCIGLHPILRSSLSLEAKLEM